jgi:hypothetical protein
MSFGRNHSSNMNTSVLSTSFELLFNQFCCSNSANVKTRTLYVLRAVIARVLMQVPRSSNLEHGLDDGPIGITSPWKHVLFPKNARLSAGI